MDRLCVRLVLDRHEVVRFASDCLGIGGLAVVWHCFTLFDIESGCWIRLSMEWSPSGVRWLALDWNRIGTEL